MEGNRNLDTGPSNVRETHVTQSLLGWTRYYYLRILPDIRIEVGQSTSLS